MKESGYKAGSYKNPQQLTQSRGWQELMKDYLSEENLLKTHQALLKSKNWRARDAALDKAYKLLGKYKADKIAFEDAYSQMTDTELNAEIKRLEGDPKYKRYLEMTAGNQ